jgi:putative RNA 2'-phosphotransferase
MGSVTYYLSMAKPKSPQALAKFIDYILGRRPDEFGLVVDSEGFVKIKELLKVITEEQGWKWVRRSHLDEVLSSLPNPPVEISDNRIRATNRDHIPQPNLVQDLPKILYTCIRRRAYPYVADKGISPTRDRQVVLSSCRYLAARMGKRIDQNPVLLCVHVKKSVDNGVVFHQTGESLYVAKSIPAGCFSGPPLPKEKPETKKKELPAKPLQPSLAGSFELNLDRNIQIDMLEGKHKKGLMDRKSDRKRLKKQKRKRERPPWRR